MKSKLIIFDLDDCLVDTWGSVTPIIVQRAVKAMVEAGLRVNSFDEAVARLKDINKYAKNGSEAIDRFLEELKAEPGLFKIGKKEFYNFDFEYSLEALPSVPEMLKKTNADFAIVTKGEMGAQIEKLRKAGIDHNIFKKIVAVEHYDKSEAYRQIIKELKYLPSDCFVCGDRYETDLIPAKYLGMKTIWVPWGRGKIFPPPKGAVDFIVTDLREIINIINN